VTGVPKTPGGPRVQAPSCRLRCRSGRRWSGPHPAHPGLPRAGGPTLRHPRRAGHRGGRRRLHRRAGRHPRRRGCRRRLPLHEPVRVQRPRLGAGVPGHGRGCDPRRPGQRRPPGLPGQRVRVRRDRRPPHRDHAHARPGRQGSRAHPVGCSPAPGRRAGRPALDRGPRRGLLRSRNQRPEPDLHERGPRTGPGSTGAAGRPPPAPPQLLLRAGRDRWPGGPGHRQRRRRGSPLAPARAHAASPRAGAATGAGPGSPRLGADHPPVDALGPGAGGAPHARAQGDPVPVGPALPDRGQRVPSALPRRGRVDRSGHRARRRPGSPARRPAGRRVGQIQLPGPGARLCYRPRQESSCVHSPPRSSAVWPA